MKIIHCADIHLDSPLLNVTDSSKRRAELLRAFADMISYADDLGAKAVIVSGDLFDSEASSSTVSSVAEYFNRFPKIDFFIVKGNHGGKRPYEQLSKKVGGNVKFFGESWSYFDLGSVRIAGRETGENDATEWQNLKTDSNAYNVLILHADIESSEYGLLDKKAVENSGAAYLALGHRHTFAQYRFGKTKCVYPGALEPRGFDEAGKCGFVVIDTEADSCELISRHLRSINKIDVDVTNITNNAAAELKLDEAFSAFDKNDYADIYIVGELSLDVNANALKQYSEQKFFAVRFTDKTKPALELEKLSKEISLRGEFVKAALNVADEKKRGDILRLGLSALSGEELS